MEDESPAVAAIDVGELGQSDPSIKSTGRRLRGAVANYLGRAIVGGEIKPGEKLTGEVENAETLNVSRSAYREAIQVLTAKGLVESRPKTGTTVLPRTRWNLLDPMVLAWAFSGEPNMGLVRDLFELRRIIEPAAARFAAERRTRHDLKSMKDALLGMRRHTLATDEGRLADRNFHDSLLRAAHNEVLLVMSASIGSAVNWTTLHKQRSRSLPRDPVPDHALVYEAIAAADADAAEAAMCNLIDLALEDTRLTMIP